MVKVCVNAGKISADIPIGRFAFRAPRDKVSAIKLFELSGAPGVPVQHFYEGVYGQNNTNGAYDNTTLAPDTTETVSTVLPLFQT